MPEFEIEDELGQILKPGSDDDAGDGGDKGDDEGKAELKALQKRIEEAEAKAKENEKLAQFWADRAAKIAPATEPTKKQEPEKVEDKDPTDFVDSLTSKGAAALRERGFVTRDEMREIMREVATEVQTQERNKLAQVAQVVGDTDKQAIMAELEDIKSRYPQMDEVAAINWATERVQSKMSQNNGGSGGQQKQGLTREQRMAAQGAGGRGRGVVPSGGDDLGDNDKELLRHIRSAGIDEKEFAWAKKNRGREW